MTTDNTATTDTPTATSLLLRAEHLEHQAALNDAYRHVTGLPIAPAGGYADTRRKQAAALRARAQAIMAEVAPMGQG
jgi:hypothetical protein